jgi:hypothetical protein
MLQAVQPSLPISDILAQCEALPSLQKGRRPWERAEKMLCKPSPERPDAVVIVDDVLTSGSHFRAAQMIVRSALPGVPICGLFLTRRVSSAERTH